MYVVVTWQQRNPEMTSTYLIAKRQSLNKTLLNEIAHNLNGNIVATLYLLILFHPLPTWECHPQTSVSTMSRNRGNGPFPFAEECLMGLLLRITFMKYYQNTSSEI